MRRAVPVLSQMLRSKVASDKLETIDYFIAAHEFGVAQSEEGIRRMANLIWSRDPVVKKAVVGAFERLYIDVAVDNGRFVFNDYSGGWRYFPIPILGNCKIGLSFGLFRLFCFDCFWIVSVFQILCKQMSCRWLSDGIILSTVSYSVA